MRPGCPGWSWAARARGEVGLLGPEAFLAGFAARQSVILDGKGDSDFAAAVVDAYLAGWQAAGHLACPASTCSQTSR
jgi:hypothetical protein